MDQVTKEALSKTIYTDMESTNGRTDAYIEGTGNKMPCMVVESLPGWMDASTQENTSWTRRQAMESSHGQTEESTKAAGKMANSMDRDYTLRKLELRRKENGSREKELNGLTVHLLKWIRKLNRKMIINIF